MLSSVNISRVRTTRRRTQSSGCGQRLEQTVAPNYGNDIVPELVAQLLPLQFLAAGCSDIRHR